MRGKCTKLAVGGLSRLGKTARTLECPARAGGIEVRMAESRQRVIQAAERRHDPTDRATQPSEPADLPRRSR
jgi:hypothetical protein